MMIEAPWSLVRGSSRAARLTASPIAVYAGRFREPRKPTTASPVLMPTPQRIGTPILACHLADTLSTRSWSSSPVRTAFAAWSGFGSGAL